MCSFLCGCVSELTGTDAGDAPVGDAGGGEKVGVVLIVWQCTRAVH